VKRIKALLRRQLSSMRYLTDRQLLRIHRQGGMVDLYQKLNHAWLRGLGIATILDIGANVGQFALTIHPVLPKAQIISFEPLPECFKKLKHAMRHTKNFTALNVALGDKVGVFAFEQNAFSDSSSFLSMAEEHKQLFPFTRKSQQIQVAAERLDNLAPTLPISEPLLIKIDVQGFEERVLRGGEQTVRRAKLLIVETGFEALYEGQPLFDDLYRLLVSWGFRYHGSLDALTSPTDGRVLQENSVFIKV
jgi:FkbM family methyltransferase